jgi:hypothetical protein
MTIYTTWPPFQGNNNKHFALQLTILSNTTNLLRTSTLEKNERHNLLPSVEADTDFVEKI